MVNTDRESHLPSRDSEGKHLASCWVFRGKDCTCTESRYSACAHGSNERECFRCHAEGPTVQLPTDWRREGMVVVADSWTGRLLGCMGRETWEEMKR